ncbi:hypothetical protein [Dysgonomonas sp. GY617]|uniref:hypothetical protein n=1 Tax=Dysgonomonas sp. GY617 TaxID=2780420 RepID=UPI00188324E4|nr:hypothetical protein [Dysgonomonas sp. GY617]MBF0576623.1 hypothetical protein [Dysgonomonas sp. GY617]
MDEEIKNNGLTISEIVDDVHNTLIMELEDYADDDYLKILRALISKLNDDADAIESEIRYHNRQKK